MSLNSLLPQVARYALAVIAGCLVVALSRAVGFPLVWLAVLVLSVEVAWLYWDRLNVHDKADVAVSRLKDIEHHLTVTEPPGHGRHATSASPAPHPRRTTP